MYGSMEKQEHREPDRAGERYMWFDDVRVERAEIGIRCCIVNGKRVLFPFVNLHPNCTLWEPGDVGRLGVPVTWAVEHGLVPGLRP